MADDILSKIDQMGEASVFTGERINVAGKLTSFGKVLETVGAGMEATSKAKAKAVEKAAEKSTIPAVRALKSRGVEKSVIPTDKKPRKKLVVLEADIKTPENELLNQSQIDETLTPIDETINPIADEAEAAAPTSGMPETTVDTSEAPVDVIESIGAQTTRNVSEGMAKEPAITGEQLSAGITKSKEDIAKIRQEEADLLLTDLYPCSSRLCADVILKGLPCV